MSDPSTPTDLYRSRPQLIEAVQWTGDNWIAVYDFAGEKVDRPTDRKLVLLAGKDGAQEWVPVPVGHWLVHAPGDLSDIWPVAPDYFAAKYEKATDV